VKKTPGRATNRRDAQASALLSSGWPGTASTTPAGQPPPVRPPASTSTPFSLAGAGHLRHRRAAGPATSTAPAGRLPPVRPPASTSTPFSLEELAGTLADPLPWPSFRVLTCGAGPDLPSHHHAGRVGELQPHRPAPRRAAAGQRRAPRHRRATGTAPPAPRRLGDSHQSATGQHLDTVQPGRAGRHAGRSCPVAFVPGTHPRRWARARICPATSPAAAPRAAPGAPASTAPAASASCRHTASTTIPFSLAGLARHAALSAPVAFVPGAHPRR